MKNVELMQAVLQALGADLEHHVSERQRLHAEYTAKLVPLDKEISRLEAARAHQQHALSALAVRPKDAFEVENRPEHDKPSLPADVPAVEPPRRLTDVAVAILTDAGKPMHYKAIADAVVSRGVFISAKDPGAFVIGYLRREPKRFCRTATAGEYALVEWELEDARAIEPDGGKKASPATKRSKTARKR